MAKRNRVSIAPVNILIAILVGAVIFVMVSTITQEQESSLDGLSETELVRLFDDIDTRIGELTNERNTLRTELNELRSGADTQAAAAEAAAYQEAVRKVHAGVVPVTGPGVIIRIYDAAGQLPAQTLVTVIQELRNSAAEAIEINGIRVVTRTAIVQDGGSILVDGTAITSPYTIRAIGDSDMMRVALEMPGGILAAIRSRGPTTDLFQQESVDILSVAELPEFSFAEPVN